MKFLLSWSYDFVVLSAYTHTKELINLLSAQLIEQEKVWFTIKNGVFARINQIKLNQVSQSITNAFYEKECYLIYWTK